MDSRHASEPRYSSQFLRQHLQLILLIKDEVFLPISIARADRTHRLEHLNPSQNDMTSDLTSIVLEIVPMYEGAFHVESGFGDVRGFHSPVLSLCAHPSGSRTYAEARLVSPARAHSSTPGGLSMDV